MDSLYNKIFFYRVCPFQASFSAAWWFRLGVFFLRVYRLIWLVHVAFLYVDDFFIPGRSNDARFSMSPLHFFPAHSGSNLLEKMRAQQYSEMDRMEFHPSRLQFPEDKLKKTLQYLEDLLVGNRTSRKRVLPRCSASIGITGQPL